MIFYHKIRINRNIVECKLKEYGDAARQQMEELIETLWNVN